MPTSISKGRCGGMNWPIVLGALRLKCMYLGQLGFVTSERNVVTPFLFFLKQCSIARKQLKCNILIRLPGLNFGEDM